jgi:hypothetical protein
MDSIKTIGIGLNGKLAKLKKRVCAQNDFYFALFDLDFAK